MTERTETPTAIEAFTINPELLPHFHLWLAQTGVPPAHVVVAMSAIVAVALDMDDDQRIAWIRAVATAGYIDPAIMGEARENMAQCIEEMRANATR